LLARSNVLRYPGTPWEKEKENSTENRSHGRTKLKEKDMGKTRK
jgi:hypothetical protein